MGPVCQFQVRAVQDHEAQNSSVRNFEFVSEFAGDHSKQLCERMRCSAASYFSERPHCDFSVVWALSLDLRPFQGPSMSNNMKRQ